MSKHKRSFIVLFLVLFLLPTQAEDIPQKSKVYNGYSGGMMLHLGYLFGENKTFPYNPQGLTYGIGGALRVNLWQHLRVGTEGYVSTIKTGASDHSSILQTGSYIRNTWGGLLADVYWKCGKFWPYIGGTIGGGVKNSLFIPNGNLNDWKPEIESIVNKQAYFLVAPFFGFSYLLTPRIHFTLKVDYVLAIHKSQLLTPTGPRLYFGILFGH